MAPNSAPFRHLPPTAVPVRASDLQAGLSHAENALERFRSALATYLGVSQEACRLAASGRAALYCLLRGLQAEDPSRQQIVMPAYTCPAVARVAIDCDLQPIFVDISATSMNMLPQQLARAVSEQTLAVVHVHPFGIPLPFEDLTAVAHASGAAVIEDAAQALGAKWEGKPVGTNGDFGLFSLGPGKPISTGGGGVVIANKQRDIAKLEKWWQHLPQSTGTRSATAWLRQAMLQLLFQPPAWWAATRVGLHRLGNSEASWGYAVHGLAPSQAGVGLSLLPRLDAINSQRRQRASQIREALRQSPNVNTLTIAEQAEPFFLRFPLLAQSFEQREALFDQLWSKGIGVGRLYERTLPAIYFPEQAASFPGATAVAKRLLTLPTHHYVREQDVELMQEILRQFT